MNKAMKIYNLRNEVLENPNRYGYVDITKKVTKKAKQREAELFKAHDEEAMARFRESLKG
jgi:hypothetical protein